LIPANDRVLVTSASFKVFVPPLICTNRFRLIGVLPSMALRALATCYLAPRMGISGVAFACVIGWSVMLLFEVPYYFYTCKKQLIP
jgi:Na+-driven multidrug efflux pump